MALRKIKLGQLLELCENKNKDLKFTIEDVKGISIKKQFIETRADMDGVSLKPYLIVEPDEFAYVPTTSRNGEKITIAHNDSNDTYIVSSSYIVFRVKEPQVINSDYLFMYFNRPEFDRLSRYNSWGSARETFTWQELCDIKIELPELPTQERFVNIYKAMVENQKAYEKGLDDLKLVCNGYIEDLRRHMSCKEIGEYLELRCEQNLDRKYGHDKVMGVSQCKSLIKTRADTKGNDISKFTIIYPNDFVYNPRNGIAIALNSSNNNYIISWNNTAFYIKKEFLNMLLPQYLMLWFERSEWDRKVKVDSWGSSTEVYSFDALCGTKIPIPSINIQKSIANIYECYLKRKEINEKLKQQIKSLCPILIKGSIEEAR